jgi:hypothetical protein
MEVDNDDLIPKKENFISSQSLNRRKKASVVEGLDDKLKNDSNEKSPSKDGILNHFNPNLHVVSFMILGIVVPFLVDDALKSDSNEKSLSNKEITLKYSIHALHHIVYAFAVVGIIASIIAQSITKTQNRLVQLLNLSVAIPLVVDNLRLGIPGLPNQVHLILSKICFFAHEVITPFSVLYVARGVAVLVGSATITFNSPQKVSHTSVIITIAAVISSGLSFLGLQRFISYSGWDMVSTNGISICRPTNPSHAALLPIFLTVGGLVLVSGWAHFILHRPNEEQWMVLFISQLVVFFGNGIIGPSKMLSGLFGNAFEVLWLWSIVSTIH